MLQHIMEWYPDDQFLKLDGFDEAIIGVDEHSLRLIYSQRKILDILVNDGMTEEDAVYHYGYNIQSAYYGEDTPIICADDYWDMIIDLHGLRYKEVEPMLEKHLLVRYNRDGWQIITGNSPPMKSIVIEFLEEHGFGWYIPLHNSGMIIVSDIWNTHSEERHTKSLGIERNNSSETLSIVKRYEIGQRLTTE